MDNRIVDIVSEGDKALALALEIVWDSAPGGTATHYKVMKLRRKTEYYFANQTGRKVSHHYDSLVEDPKGIPTLILLWHEEGKATPFAYEHSLKQALEFVRGWLAQVDYGPEPDHDGSNGKGWRVFTESWGHVAGHLYSIAGIQPAWAMYGK